MIQKELASGANGAVLASVSDNYKGTRTGQQRLFPLMTVLSGKRTPARG